MFISAVGATGVPVAGAIACCVTQYSVYRATALSGSSRYPVHGVRTHESALRLQSCMENLSIEIARF